MTQFLPLRDQLKTLEHIQELDLKIDNLKKNKAALPVSLKELDDSINKINSAMGVKKSALAEIEKVDRQTSAALDLNKDRMSRSSTKLDGVKNSQQFQAASKEIEQIKKLNATLEEQQKKSSQEVSGLQQEISVYMQQIEKIKQERDAKASLVSEQDGKLNADIAQLNSERGALAAQMEVKILNQYDRVRGARAGVGIVPATGGRCKGCNMVVPPQLFNQIQKGVDLYDCPSCHRILFVHQDPQPSASVPA